MSLIDRINDRIVRRLRRDAPRIVVDGDALRVTTADGAERRLRFADLTRATVLHRDVYAADAIVLEMTFAGGERMEMFQDDAQWPALVAALDRSGRTATPSATWELQAIAGGPDAPPLRLI